MARAVYYNVQLQRRLMYLQHTPHIAQVTESPVAAQPVRGGEVSKRESKGKVSLDSFAQNLHLKMLRRHL